MREDTLQIIEEYSIKTAGNKKNIEKAEVLVSPDEKIFFIAPTNMIITTNNTRKKEKQHHYNLCCGMLFLMTERKVKT